MKTVKQLQLLGLAVILVLVSACQSKPKDGLTDTYTSGVIAIAADESFQPIVQEEVDVFEGVFPLAGIVPRYVTEVEAVNLLLKDSLRLAITSRRLTPEEMNSFNSRKFFPQEIKIATDGLALITNRENPDTLITVNEIRSILTGKVTQWKEIYPASRLKDIRLVFDNKNSSTVRFAVDSICKGAPLSDQVKALKTNREVIDFVSKTPDAIGIIGVNWLSDRNDSTGLSFSKEVRVMSVSAADKATLIQGVYPSLDRQEYLDAHVAPVFFGSALNNFGIRELLDCFIEIAPAPLARETEERPVRPEEEKFTGFVFKIHANMDPNHRDRIAFVKICSGIFKRNTNYLHVRNGKMLKFSTPTAFMASKKSVIDEAYPGDIIGLHDTGTFKIGDTLTEGEKLHFKGIPSFSPELFKYIENADPMKSKQLAKGIDQLMDEGVAQLFVSQFNNRKIIGTVGALQFEVIEYRLLHEYAAACRWEPINLYKACWIEAQDQAELEDFKKHKAQYMAKDKEGRDVFLADSQYMLHMAQENYKKLIFHFTSEF